MQRDSLSGLRLLEEMHQTQISIRITSANIKQTQNIMTKNRLALLIWETRNLSSSPPLPSTLSTIFKEFSLVAAFACEAKKVRQARFSMVIEEYLAKSFVGSGRRDNIMYSILFENAAAEMSKNNSL